jgi:hypothetical protein
MVFGRKKILFRWFDFIGEKKILGPMIDTIGQKWEIFNQWIDTIGCKHDQWYRSIISIDKIGIDPLIYRRLCPAMLESRLLGPGEAEGWKLKQKISWHCPFKQISYKS